MNNAAEAQPSRKSLVLVVGAGASHEVKLPLGAELKMRIGELLDIRFEFSQISGDELIAQSFRRVSQSADITPLVTASWRIRDAVPQAISIDNFIDAHRSDRLIAQCGKLAIVRSILQAESGSSLFIGSSTNASRLDFHSLESTWYNAFFQTLTENCQFEELPQRFSQVAVICFNYDRCIQHYLHNALQNYYGRAPEEAATALRHLEFHHPYGVVGSLPWSQERNPIKFGATPTAAGLVELAQGIKTFTEGANEGTSDIARVRHLLASTERVAFLGFAFHPLNVRLLFAPRVPKRTAQSWSRRVYATGMGISAPDAMVIAEELHQLGGFDLRRIYIAQTVTCAKLFADYRRSLSFTT
jgi:hypothetical protein